MPTRAETAAIEKAKSLQVKLDDYKLRLVKSISENDQLKAALDTANRRAVEASEQASTARATMIEANKLAANTVRDAEENEEKARKAGHIESRIEVDRLREALNTIVGTAKGVLD